MRVGDIIPNQTMQSFFPPRTLKAVPGICVYIHPQRRFYTLEYKLSGGSVRESYPIQYRRGEG